MILANDMTRFDIASRNSELQLGPLRLKLECVELSAAASPSKLLSIQIVKSTKGRTMKAAIAILSDPKSGGEEALGRLFNGLAAAYDFKERGTEVAIYFQGTGTRWVGEVGKPEHPVHALYKAVEDKVAGVSCGCADVFGAREDAVKNGFDLITDNKVPGTSGLPSLAKLVEEGYTVYTF